MSSTSLTVTQQSLVALRGLLDNDAYKRRFQEILNERAPLFMAAIVNYLAASPQLAQCDPKSIIASAMISATLNLPIEKALGFAYIVPYGDQASFQLGYRGLIQLAMRSGQYARMKDACINQAAFGGYDEVGEPIILWDKLDETEPPVGYAFAWKTTNGFCKCVYWTRDHVEKHAKKYSRSWGKSSSPWSTNFDAMALKTVILSGLRKYGILSVDMQRGISQDDVPMEINEAGDLVPAAVQEGAKGPEGAAPVVTTETLGEKLTRKRGRPPKDVTPGQSGNPPATVAGVVQPTGGDKGLQEAVASAAPASEPAKTEAPAPASAPPAPTEAPPAPKNAPGANAGGEGEDPAARQTVIDGVQDKMLELGISETRLMKYALKLQGFVPEGCKSVWDLETTKIAKLKFALPALSVGREPALP